MMGRIEFAGQSFSRQSMAGRCGFTAPIFWLNFFHYFVYNRKEHSCCRGPDTLLTDTDRGVWSWPWHFALVCVCFSNGLGQTSYTSHTGTDGRWFINLQHYFLLNFPSCVCHTKKRRILSDDYNDEWAMNLEGYERKWSQSMSNCCPPTATEQTENEPMSPNDRPRPHHWANLLYIYQ